MKPNILCSSLGFGWKAPVHSYDARTTGRDGEGRARTHARASAHTRARTQHAARSPAPRAARLRRIGRRAPGQARRGRASPSARTTSLSPVRPKVRVHSEGEGPALERARPSRPPRPATGPSLSPRPAPRSAAAFQSAGRRRCPQKAEGRGASECGVCREGVRLRQPAGGDGSGAAVAGTGAAGQLWQGIGGRVCMWWKGRGKDRRGGSGGVEGGRGDPLGTVRAATMP